MKIVLSFLFGGIVGWFLRHLRWRKELKEFRRQRLRENAGGLAAMDRQQLVEARKSAESVGASEDISASELARLKDAADELDQSRERIQSLSRGLAAAESELQQAREHDLELRRLRSECQSLQHERDVAASELAAFRDSAASGAADTEGRSSPPDDVAESSSAASTVARLEQRLAERERRIGALERRLQDVRNAGAASSASPPAAGHRNAAAVETPLEPLFEAPDERDDLKRINGIGPKIEQKLNELGITTYRQLALLSADDIARVGEALQAFPGRIERDDWVGGARRQLQASDSKASGR